MNVDSSGNMVVSPISVRGQERLARLRASIQQQFGSGERTGSTASCGLSMDHHHHHMHSSTHSHAQAQMQPNSRKKIRQRIEQASKMTSDEIFFREFGSPKQLMALDFDLARTEQPRLVNSFAAESSARSSNAMVGPVNGSRATATQQHSTAQTAFSSSSSSARTEQTRVGGSAEPRSAASSAANRSHSGYDRSHSRSSTQVTDGRTATAASASAFSAAHANARSHAASSHAVERPAYVSQLQRPTRILTPKKQGLKRARAADEPPSAEKALPPAQKPRLLTDVTSTFNNRSFSNVGQACGSVSSSSSSNSSSVATSSASSRSNQFVNSPVRKAPAFARPTMMQLPSPSKFRVPTSTTRLFGQRQATYR